MKKLLRSVHLHNIKSGKFSLSAWAIVGILIVVLSIIFNLGLWKRSDRVIKDDVYAYYAYLPSVFIYHDLSLMYIDKLQEEGIFITWPKILPDNKRVILVSMGMSFLYLPFFLPAHVYAVVTHHPPTGYSPPYKFALILSTITFLIIGLIYLRKLLLKYFEELPVAIVLIVTVLFTNMLWYTVVESPMTHVYSFALITVFLYHTDRWYENLTLKRTIYLGLLAGLITLIRPTNILIVVLFLLWKIQSWNDLKLRIRLLLNKVPHLLVMVLCSLLVWLPQMLYWKMQTGQFLYYSYPDDQGFFFNNPQIFNSLFSWRKGWLIYTPVMIFALMGIPLLRHYHRELIVPVLTYVMLTIYVLSSWWDWWFGGGLSIRAYIDMYGVLAIPMAATLTWFFNRKRIVKYIWIAVFSLIAARTLFHHIQYHYGAIHWVAMTREAFFDSFWRIRPSERFYTLIKNPDYELARKGIYKYEGESDP